MIVETLLYAQGPYTPNTVIPAGKVVGAVGAALDAAFHHNVCDTEVDDSCKKALRLLCRCRYVLH